MTTQTASSEEPTGPRVSVVVPTYGRNEHLPDALNSVVDQTYDNVELLVVDDGSPTPVTETLTDVDLDPLESVTFIRHHENRGANAARNNGIRAATGEFVAFLDDDDYWHEEKLARQVEAFLSAGPEVGLVYTGKHTSGPQGETLMKPFAEGDVMRDLLVGEEFGQFSSFMVRASVVDEVGLLDERFPAWQDREWLFRIAAAYEFKAVKETLTYRRVGLPDRITKNFAKQRDVSYPLFVEKHYPLAKEYGFYYARAFLASLRLNLARSAVTAEEYDEARKYFWLAFLANPLYRPVYPHLIPSIGGRRTYETATYLRKQVVRAASFLR